MNALVYHLPAFDSLADSKLGERAQHIEAGQGRYVLDLWESLGRITKNNRPNLFEPYTSP